MKKRIAQVVVGLPVAGPFDYFINEAISENIAIGKRVRVEFNHQKKVGYVVNIKEHSEVEKLNPIISVLDNIPAINQNAFKLTKEIAKHYGCEWGESIETSLPFALRQERPVLIKEFNSGSKENNKTKPKKILLHDQTFFKKWDILSEKIEKCLNQKKSVIILIPESFTAAEIQEKLKNVLAKTTTIFDKKTTPRLGLEDWLKIKSLECCCVIGTRSTVFAPVNNLGLIIVYDEENVAYKQEQTPHYNAKAVALMRAKIENSDIIYVSNCPSVETFKEAKKQKWEYLLLPPEKLSPVQLIDMTNYNPQKTSILSFPLQNSITQALNNKEKILILINRRGFSTITRCNQCGLTLRCERCNINLSFSYSKKQLVCPYCNFEMELPKVCPGCQGNYLRSTGMGLEKLESEVVRYFPQAKVAGFDRESKDYPKEVDILIATQAILRHKEQSIFHLIAVVNFDGELNRFDFRSADKAFNLLIHLRLMAKKKFLVQSRLISNYALKALSKMDFKYFYRNELKNRRELYLPPFNEILTVVMRGANQASVEEEARMVYDGLKQVLKQKDIIIDEPHPDAKPKLRGKYRSIITIRSKRLTKELSAIKGVLKDFKGKKDIIITLDVDL